MSDLTFLHCAHLPQNRSVHAPKRFVGIHALQLSRGELELSVDGAARRLSGTWLWPVHPGPRIGFHAAGECGHWDHRYVGFFGPRVDWWASVGLWPPPAVRVPEEREVEVTAAFDEMLAGVRSAEPGGRLRATHLLEGLLLDTSALAGHKGSRLPEPWLDRVLARLSSPEYLDPDYTAIAAEAGMSLRTLRRRFKEAAGAPMHEYVVRRRMAAAREMLGGTDLPVKVVAQRLGYCDVYFFTRQFARHTGTTPAAYRRDRPV
jgi:AraC-like DNA-binding protein